MKTDDAGLTLQLEMRNNFKFNYWRMLLYAIPVTVGLHLLLIMVLPFVLSLVLSFISVMIVIVMLVHIYQNYSKSTYSRLLNEIANQPFSG